MINLRDLSLRDILTPSLTHDKKVLAAADALSESLAAATKDIRLALIYSRIDELDESTIDMLAWQFHVDFYEIAKSLDEKRAFVKSAIYWHRKKGTRWAVRRALSDLGWEFVQIHEWFQPEFLALPAEPHTFGVVLGRPFLPERRSDAITAIFASKPARSWLKYIAHRLTLYDTEEMFEFLLLKHKPWLADKFIWPEQPEIILGSAPTSFIPEQFDWREKHLQLWLAHHRTHWETFDFPEQPTIIHGTAPFPYIAEPYPWLEHPELLLITFAPFIHDHNEAGILYSDPANILAWYDATYVYGAWFSKQFIEGLDSRVGYQRENLSEAVEAAQSFRVFRGASLVDAADVDESINCVVHHLRLTDEAEITEACTQYHNMFTGEAAQIEEVASNVSNDADIITANFTDYAEPVDDTDDDEPEIKPFERWHKHSVREPFWRINNLRTDYLIIKTNYFFCSTNEQYTLKTHTIETNRIDDNPPDIVEELNHEVLWDNLSGYHSSYSGTFCYRSLWDRLGRRHAYDHYDFFMGRVKDEYARGEKTT